MNAVTFNMKERLFLENDLAFSNAYSLFNYQQFQLVLENGKFYLVAFVREEEAAWICICI